MSCGVGRRHGSDLVLLWLWYRLSAAAPTPSLGTPICHTCSPKETKKGKKIKIILLRVPVVAQWLMNPTRDHEVAGSVPALAQWVNDPALP